MSEDLIGSYIKVILSSGISISGEIISIKDDRFTLISGSDIFDIYRSFIAAIQLNAVEEALPKKESRRTAPQEVKPKEDFNFPQNKVGSESSGEAFFLPSDILEQSEQIKPLVDAYELSAYFGGSSNINIGVNLESENDS
jgi:hypothetical protein